MGQLIGILYEDVKHQTDTTDHSESSYRSTIRAICAWIDGMMTSLQYTLTSHKLIRDPTKVSDKELQQLLDHLGVPPSEGKRAKKRSFDDTVKCAFKCFAEACHVEFNLGIHSKEWESFRDCTQIRHRVTHPRSPVDLKITREDMVKVAESATWLQNMVAAARDPFATKYGSI